MGTIVDLYISAVSENCDPILKITISQMIKSINFIGRKYYLITSRKTITVLFKLNFQTLFFKKTLKLKTAVSLLEF